MFIIHTSSKKSKVKKKPGWRQREAEYAAWLKSHGVTSKSKSTVDSATYTSSPKVYRRETEKIASLNPENMAPCTKPADKVYTGTMIKGIGTMHKSNAIPIFSDEQAIEIATMRRG